MGVHHVHVPFSQYKIVPIFLRAEVLFPLNWLLAAPDALVL